MRCSPQRMGIDHVSLLIFYLFERRVKTVNYSGPFYSKPAVGSGARLLVRVKVSGSVRVYGRVLFSVLLGVLKLP